MKLYRMISFVLIASAMFSTSCSSSDQTGNEQNPASTDLVKTVKSPLQHQASTIADDALNAFVKGQYDLNFDILKASAAQVGTGNAMISTFSIQNALAMTWAGADGKTAEQIASALHFSDNTHDALNKLNEIVLSKHLPEEKTEYYELGAVEIHTTNDLYFSPKYTWKSTWLDILAKNYDAGIQEIQFAKDPEAARKYINDAVAADTHDRIKDLIPVDAIDTDTQFVLTNAIYFKAPWMAEFQEAGEMTFTRVDNSTIKAPQIAAFESLNYSKSDDYQSVIVPLRNHTFSVLFIMPEQGKFESVQNSLNSDMIESVFKASQFSGVNFNMPEFEFETSVSLKDPLMSMGMVDAFVNADFSKTTEDVNTIYISDVFHKSFVAMNKGGVEAAAATAVIAKDESAPAEIVNLSLDHPFMFVIYETSSRTPLFFGRVMDPAAH